MMADKKRILKVQDVGDHHYKIEKPNLRLTGFWLSSAGIKANTHVEVTNPSPGTLVITSVAKEI